MSTTTKARRPASQKNLRGTIRRRLSALRAYITTTPRIVAVTAAIATLFITATLGPISVWEYQRKAAAREATNAFLDNMAERIAITEIAANRYAQALDEFGRFFLQLELRRQTLYSEHADKLIPDGELEKGETALSDELTRHQAQIDDLRTKHEERIGEFESWRARAVMEAGRRYPRRNGEILAAFANTDKHLQNFTNAVANRALAFAVAGTLRHHGLRAAALSFRARKITEHEFRERLKEAVDVTVAEKKLPRLAFVELRTLVSRLQAESAVVP